VHATGKLKSALAVPPTNIKRGEITPFALAMPDEYKNEDAVKAYRTFYIEAKSRFATWRHSRQPRQPPDWYIHGTAT
jgi:hypothetical protein